MKLVERIANALGWTSTALWCRDVWPKVGGNLMWPAIYEEPECPEWIRKHNSLPKDSAGFFDWRTGAIWIKTGNNCWAVRWHEYGHWAFWRLHHFADGMWELPWWGLNLRVLFVRKRP